MQHRAARIFALQIILQVQRLERIFGVINRDLRAVRVIDILAAPRLQDIGKTPSVLLGEAISGSFGRRCLEIIEITGTLLIADQPGTHMIQDAERQFDALPFGQIMIVAREIAHHLVHAIDPDGGEMVAQERQVARGIGIEAAIIHFLHECPLLFERRTGDIHQSIELGHQTCQIIFEPIAQSCHVDGDNAE